MKNLEEMKYSLTHGLPLSVEEQRYIFASMLSHQEQIVSRYCEGDSLQGEYLVEVLQQKIDVEKYFPKRKRCETCGGDGVVTRHKATAISKDGWTTSQGIWVTIPCPKCRKEAE